MDYSDAVVGDTVFLRYLSQPGIVKEVITYRDIPIGYIADAEYHGIDLFRTDEVEKFDADRRNE